MGGRKKSRGSSSAAKLTSSQDFPDQVSTMASRHDYISEIQKALAANAAYQTQLKEQLRLLSSSGRLSPPKKTVENPTVTAATPNNWAVNPNQPRTMEMDGEHRMIKNDESLGWMKD